MVNNSVTNNSSIITGFVSFLLLYEQVFMVKGFSKSNRFLMKQRTRNESELFEIISNQRMQESDNERKQNLQKVSWILYHGS